MTLPPPVPVLNCVVRDGEGRTALVRATRPDRAPTEALLRHGGGTEAWSKISTLRSGYKTGMQVEHRPPAGLGRSLGLGVVCGTRVLAGFEQVLVQFADSGESRWLDWRMLGNAASVELRLAKRHTGPAPDHAERFRLRMLCKALEIWDANTGAFGRLDIDPLPHQLHVAQRVVTSSSARWLIADDVGLGKTIEVGLILHALTQRNRCRRVLIVCPSALVTQWKEEMRFKFDRAFEIYGRDFKPEYVDELRLREHVIISLDLAKREPHASLLQEVGDWDVIVFDEAHRLGRSETGEQTERYRLAHALQDRTASLLLLTATPHQGKSRRFGALLELVRPDLSSQIRTLEFNPEIVGDIIIRNRKTRVIDAQGKLVFNGHDTRRIAVTPSSEMRSFDAELGRYLRHGYQLGETGGMMGRAIGFVMTTYRKLASSSIAAIERALERRLERLRQGAAKTEPPPEAEDLEGDDLLEETTALTSPAAFFAEEAEQLDRLISLARRARPADEKLKRFIEEIATPVIASGENLLIFSEYRATQQYLAEALKRALPQIGEPALINGSMSLDDKMEHVRRFDTREAKVLISTEAGGEGLNLQRSCHLMANYDLPWNPSRLVQRIGRLYRYGQRKRVQVFNMQADDGFDNKTIALMLDRVETIARDMASVATESRDALESEILGELLSNIDMEAILERSHSMRIELTGAELDQAIETAKAAQAVQEEILQFADAHQGRVAAGFDARHMLGFVEGMLPHLGAQLRGRLHGGRVLEIELPEAMIGRFPEFRKRQVVRVAAEPALARRLQDVAPLDFDAPFVQRLAELARDRRNFDGLYAEASGTGIEGVLAVYQLRWQDPSGQLLDEELLPIHASAERVTRLPDQAFAALLLQPMASDAANKAAPTPTDLELVAARDAEIRRSASGSRMPGSVVLAAAARLVSKSEPDICVNDAEKVGHKGAEKPLYRSR